MQNNHTRLGVTTCLVLGLLAACASSSAHDPAMVQLRAEGLALLKAGHITEARAIYEKALANDSDDIKAWNGLGVALDSLGQHSAAQQAYRSALDQDPDNVMTLNNLAHSYVLVGGYQQAIQLLEPHAQDKEAPSALHQTLAEAYGLAGMTRDAERLARMDLPPDQVKQKLTTYHAQRLRLGLIPKFYADLGTETTESIAHNHADEVKNKFGLEAAGLVMNVAPDVAAVGGTPHFNIRVLGFTKASKLNMFCDRLKKAGYMCKVQKNG